MPPSSRLFLERTYADARAGIFMRAGRKPVEEKREKRKEKKKNENSLVEIGVFHFHRYLPRRLFVTFPERYHREDLRLFPFGGVCL